MYANLVNLLLIITESGWSILDSGASEWLSVCVETSFVSFLLVSITLHNRLALWYKFVGIKLKQLIKSIINFCYTPVLIANWFRCTVVYPLCSSYLSRIVTLTLLLFYLRLQLYWAGRAVLGSKNSYSLQGPSSWTQNQTDNQINGRK